MQICIVKKRVVISEPERLERFMHSFNENHSEERGTPPRFRALVIHLISNSDITTVSKQTGLAESALYDWQSDWNKKKSQAYKTTGAREADPSHA